MRLLRYGPDALLVELDSVGAVRSAHAALLAAALPGTVELVPAARTVLVAFTVGGCRPDLVRAVLDGAALDGVDPTTVRAHDAQDRVIRVRYDGPDLALVAETAGLSTSEIIDLHTGPTYTVAFTGFAPGFGYLTGLPESLHQTRLDTPRSAVPPGSVGIAGEFTGVYPRSSPGGWRLIGHTDVVLFDQDREPPALLAPGDRVRFEVAS